MAKRPKPKRRLRSEEDREWGRRLNVHESSVRRYRFEGCPFEQGETAVYEWLAAKGKGANRGRGGRKKAAPAGDASKMERARQQADLDLKLAKAREAWLRVHEKEGKLIPTAASEEAAGKLMTEVRTAVLGLPRAVAERMVGLQTPQEAEALLAAAVDDLLGRLSRGAD